MTDFTFKTAVITDEGTDWLFTGPDPTLIYGLHVNRSTGYHQGFSRSQPGGLDSHLGPAQTARLVALSNRAANPVSRTLDEAVALLKALRPEADARQAPDNETLQLAIDRLEKVSRFAGDLYDASEALLNAYGGDTPDWLRTEAVQVEDALISLRKTAAPLPQDDHRTITSGFAPK